MLIVSINTFFSDHFCNSSSNGILKVVQEKLQEGGNQADAFLPGFTKGLVLEGMWMRKGNRSHKVFNSVISSVFLELSSSLETYISYNKVLCLYNSSSFSKCYYILLYIIWSSPKTLNHSKYTKLEVTLKDQMPASQLSPVTPRLYPLCSFWLPHFTSTMTQVSLSLSLLFPYSFFSLLRCHTYWSIRWERRKIFRIYLISKCPFLKMVALNEIIALEFY